MRDNCREPGPMSVPGHNCQCLSTVELAFRSTCRTWSQCQSRYEADDEICRIPFVVAREVQCDGRMAMEIEQARVQNRLHPLMVSVPESFPVAGHGVEEESLWCCSIRLEIGDVEHGDIKPEDSGGELEL